MGAAGFAIGSGIVVALGIDWNWVAVLVGLAVGILVGLVSVFANIPMIMLVVIGSIAGAVGVVGGLMLLFGSLNTADFSRGDFTDTVSNNFLWWLLFVVLVVGGIFVQLRQRALMNQSVREVWYAEAS
jgi:nitrate/nitrite transporter NarK